VNRGAAGVTPAAARTLARACGADPGFDERPRSAGKFLCVGEDKLWVRGVTYGTFATGPDGDDYPPDAQLEQDFAAMRANAVNSVRCYTVPPRRLLDAAQRHGLRVMVGLPWEQHIAFLDEPQRAGSIEQRVREGVRRCAGHPAVLCYAIGNEIPASIVRWHGRRRVERFLERLYRAAKAEDPQALVTYVNFPTTEYLQLPFLDLLCFNVYLESRERLEAYLDRLQNLAGEKPLLMAEIGLDSRRNGLERQAESLEWQVRTAFAAGCAGAFAFAWTDEWHRGGHDIGDWDFGLVTRTREPKPALAAVRRAFAEVPFPAATRWPRISVVVCSYNGARTIRDTMEGLQRLAYPEVEVIVVNDGSTDATPRIVAGYEGVRLISTENRGLSEARNTGWQQATGEIVAYIDDDAYPDPHWLHYLAYRFMTGDWVGVGGPNIAPPGDGPIADCVANAPGGPVQVLLTDTEAEHVPGCNMAFRREALAAIDGFDPRYRAAGDDVDLCWRLQQRGGRIGFHAGAMDWHHRRNSLKMYWNQQKGLRQGRGAAGREVARALQRQRPPVLGRAPVWPRFHAAAALRSLAHLRRCLGVGGLPVAVRTGTADAAGAAADARVVVRRRSAGGTVAAGLVLAAVAVGGAVRVARRGAAAGAGGTGGSPRAVPTAGAIGRRACAALGAGLLHASAATVGAADRPPEARADALAAARTGAGRAGAGAALERGWRAPEAWLAALEDALRAPRRPRAPRRRQRRLGPRQSAAACSAACAPGIAVEEHGAGRQLLRLARRRAARSALTARLYLAGAAALAAAAALSGGLVAAAILAALLFALGSRSHGDKAHALAAWSAACRSVDPAAQATGSAVQAAA
jgi:O-antigen biosynthesis protein